MYICFLYVHMCTLKMKNASLAKSSKSITMFCTNADTSSASEDEGSLRRQGRLAPSMPYQGHGHAAVEHWFNRVIQGSSTSSSASSTSSHPGGRSATTNTTAHAALNVSAAATALADLMAHTQLGQWHTQSHSASRSVWCVPFLMNARLSSR